MATPRPKYLNKMGSGTASAPIVSPNDIELRLRANGIERLVLELRQPAVEGMGVAA